MRLYLRPSLNKSLDPYISDTDNGLSPAGTKLWPEPILGVYQEFVPIGPDIYEWLSNISSTKEHVT